MKGKPVIFENLPGKKIMLKKILFVVILIPNLLVAAGLEDALNYKPKVGVSIESAASPFAVKDIVDAIPYTLDKGGLFVDGPSARGSVVDLNKWDNFLNDPRLIAFQRESFGKCEDFYFDSGRPGWGSGVFKNTLIFAFSEDESRKKNASVAIKYGLDGLEKNATLGRNCESRIAYTKKMKEIVNSILEAAPSIKAESTKMVQFAQQQRSKEKNDQEAKNLKAQDERVAKEKAADETAKELKRKELACVQSPAYQLYSASMSIVRDNSIKARAANIMERQQEGAKVSGYINKSEMADAGLAMADANKRISGSFADYRKLGGKASKPVDVSAPRDPCY